jgi:hypothetical protein
MGPDIAVPLCQRAQDPEGGRDHCMDHERISLREVMLNRKVDLPASSLEFRD